MSVGAGLDALTEVEVITAHAETADHLHGSRDLLCDTVHHHENCLISAIASMQIAAGAEVAASEVFLSPGDIRPGELPAASSSDYLPLGARAPPSA